MIAGHFMRGKIAIAPRRSVALFALLSIAMVIVSYILVIVLAAVCVYLPYLIIANMEHPNAQIGILFLAGVVIAVAMLWSLVPRREKFEAPGPVLERDSHPRLFAELEDIAASLNEPLPREVYLIGEVNAFVAYRGGILGLGSHRIMAIGLPLLSTLNVSEFRGVVAHEFGHYYSGDTSIGPWVYKTQMAMIRTFRSIGTLEGVRVGAVQLMYGVVSFVLKKYFVGFLRVVNFVSRRKEHRADELACLVAGSAPCMRGMRKIHGSAMAWVPYWNSEVAPVLNQGCRPDIADGFARFLAAPEVAAQVAQGIEREIAEGKTQPYATHPPLRDRIAAIERLGIAATEESAEPALSLLGGPEAVELQFLKFINPKLEEGSLRRVGWDVLGTMVTIPAWKSALASYGVLLQGVTAEALPEVIPKLPDIGRQIRDPKGTLLTPQQRAERAGRLVVSAVALTLLDKGWQLETQPGQFHFCRDGKKINALDLVDELIAGKLSADAWAGRCDELGIRGAPLCSGVTIPPPSLN
jgi:heat shock protein HtpX